jgi:hypothetical protein
MKINGVHQQGKEYWKHEGKRNANGLDERKRGEEV